MNEYSAMLLFLKTTTSCLEKNSPTPQQEQQQEATVNPRTLATKSLQYVA